MYSTGSTSSRKTSTRRAATCSSPFSISRNSRARRPPPAPWVSPGFSANVRGMSYGPADAIDPTRLRRALVIQLRHHGDVLLTSPVFTVLKNRAPALEIDALVYAETREMLDLHPAIAQVHVVRRDWKDSGTAARLVAEWRLLSMIRSRGFELVGHLSHHPRGTRPARARPGAASVAPHLRRETPPSGK